MTSNAYLMVPRRTIKRKREIECDDGEGQRIKRRRLCVKCLVECSKPTIGMADLPDTVIFYILRCSYRQVGHERKITKQSKLLQRLILFKQNVTMYRNLSMVSKHFHELLIGSHSSTIRHLCYNIRNLFADSFIKSRMVEDSVERLDATLNWLNTPSNGMDQEVVSDDIKIRLYNQHEMRIVKLVENRMVHKSKAMRPYP